MLLLSDVGVEVGAELVADADVEVEVESVVGMEVVEDGVTRHEQADETLEARPPQFDTNVGRGAVAGAAVKVGQNAATSAGFPIIWRRQLSWLQFGATTVAVARFC